MIMPPRPGNMSCTIDAAVRSLSMLAESNKPLTTIASDSSSESNTFTSLSLGSGRGCVWVAMASPFWSRRLMPDSVHTSVILLFRGWRDAKVSTPSDRFSFEFTVLIRAPAIHRSSESRHFRVVAFPRRSGRMPVSEGATPGLVRSSNRGYVGRDTRGYYERIAADRAVSQFSDRRRGHPSRTRRGGPKNPPPAADDEHGDVRDRPGPQLDHRRGVGNGRRRQARRPGHVP